MADFCLFVGTLYVPALIYLPVKSNCSSDQILDLLIPDDEADMSDLVLEVTAGVGGQEAMLFTAEVWKRFSFIM